MLRRGLQLAVLAGLAAVATSAASAAADPEHDCVTICELSHHQCEAQGGTYDHSFNCGAAWDPVEQVCDLDTTCTYVQGG